MKHHFECPHLWRDDKAPLVFDWDDETGEITGPGAEEILEQFRFGSVGTAEPASWPLTSTKSKTDLAAVVGKRYILPPELTGYYPQTEYDEDDNGFMEILDSNGAVIQRIPVIY
jgi:hypothetical protein